MIVDCDVVVNMYATIAALRNAGSILMEKLAGWFPTVVQFAEAVDLVCEAELRQLWLMLGSDMDVMCGECSVFFSMMGDCLSRDHVAAELASRTSCSQVSWLCGDS